MNLLRPFQALWAAVRRLLLRRRVRQLRALGLKSAAEAVRGLLPGPRPSLPLALRSPGPLEPPAGSTEQWALPLGAEAVRRPGSTPRLLLRLSALPPPLPPLGVLRPARFGLDADARPSAQQRALSPFLARPPRSDTLVFLEAIARHALPPRPQVEFGVARPRPFGLDQEFAPARLAESASLEHPALPVPRPLAVRTAPRMLELGAALPARFGLDGDGRVASEREPLLLSSGRAAPPRPGRWLRPRAPLAKAPLWRLRLQNFRIDPATGAPANEGIVASYAPPPRAGFLIPAFDREFCQARWMARSWILFLSALPVELFAWWWLIERLAKSGANLPVESIQPEDISYRVFHDNREQMLIRRDVVRDQEGPGLSTFEIYESKPQILEHASLKRLDQLIPKQEWVVKLSIATEPVFDESRPVFDAYVQWRTLVNGLEER